MSSAMPLPTALATVTRPARAALTRPGTADQRLGPELQGIDVVVVDPPVDDVHRHLAVGGAQEDVGAMADQVPPFHQVDAHQSGQQGVLVEGRVVHARRQHHHGGVGHAAGGGQAEGADQAGRIVGHHLDRLAPEHLGQHAGHGGPVGQHVAHPRRAAEVVLEDPELAVLVAHDVDAGHVDPYAVGRVDPVDGPEEARRAGDHVVGDDPVVEDAGAVVDVGQEGLQRPDPLGHPLGDRGPTRGR